MLTFVMQCMQKEIMNKHKVNYVSIIRICTTALTRNDVSSRVRSLQLEKVASDACVSYCATEAVENPDCSLSFCSNACVSNTNCTAFCIRQPASIGQPCSCELQSIPGIPLSNDLLRAETGASYWMVYA